LLNIKFIRMADFQSLMVI